MKKFLSFEFWQKFGKALMVVIAVMPAAGLMISIGKTLAISFASIPFLVTTGKHRLGNHCKLAHSLRACDRGELG